MHRFSFEGFSLLPATAMCLLLLVGPLRAATPGIGVEAGGGFNILSLELVF